MKTKARCKDHPLFETYHAMISRCQNAKSKIWKNYGGRGIKVCERWQRKQKNTQGFWNFVADMGPRPDGYAIGRHDINGDYSPGNCFWGDFATQCKNRRGRWSGNKASKLTAQDVKAIRSMRDQGHTVKSVMAQFDISSSHCYRIFKEQSWRNVSD